MKWLQGSWLFESAVSTKMIQCELASKPLPLVYVENPHPSRAVPIFLGLWLLALLLFELHQVARHKPTISQWIKGVGLTRWFLRIFWVVGVVLLVWHLVWGGPL